MSHINQLKKTIFMKKVILSLVVVAALSTVSCKKNYTCTCTIVYSGALAGTPNATITYTIDDTKSKAKTACTSDATTATAGGAGETATCSIN